MKISLKDAVVSVSALGVMSAVCGILCSSERYNRAIRLMMGLQIIRICISAFSGLQFLPE